MVRIETKTLKKINPYVEAPASTGPFRTMNNPLQPPERYAYFVTAVTNRRLRILNRSDVAGFIFENVNFYRDKYGFRFCGFVLMPDHWHFILIAATDQISSILRDMKSMIARKVIDEWKKSENCALLLDEIRRETTGDGNWEWALWQPGNWKVVTDNIPRIESQLTYLHMNPVRANLVDAAVDWELSSASWYIKQQPCGIRLDTDWS